MRGYACIGLDYPKNNLNVGATLRAAGCYGAKFIATTGCRYHKAPTDCTKQFRHIPLIQVRDLRDAVPFDCVPVAVELVEGAVSLPRYSHPNRAFYIFGAEDATLGRERLSWCREVVYIPTRFCMNLAACVNVVLYDRMAKRMTTYPNYGELDNN